MKLRNTFLLSLILVLIFVCGSTAAKAAAPTEAIRAAVNQGLEILKNAKLDNPTQRAQVIDRLRQIVYPLFDFNEMAMRSMGTNWRRLNPEQRKEFVSTFTALLEKTYADQIDVYKGQQVTYKGEKLDGDYAEVDSRIIDKGDKTYSVVYKLHNVDSKWRIYDVVAENISLVGNYRSQFERVLGKSSVEELLKTMKERAS